MKRSFKPPEQRIAFVLYRVGKEIARSYERRLAPLGLRPEHVGILTAIAAGGPMHVRGLSRLLGINRQTVVNAVNHLESQRTVTKIINPSDSRQVLVGISSKGLTVLAKVEDDVVARYDASVESIGTVAERTAVLSYLAKLAKSDVLT